MLNTNITQFRKNLFELLEQTIKFNEPINVSTQNGNAIILSEEDYNGLIEILRDNPYKTPPPCEKLQGDLLGALSHRINIKHRFVYQVYEEEHTVKIISMWSHYEF